MLFKTWRVVKEMWWAKCYTGWLCSQ